MISRRSRTRKSPARFDPAALPPRQRNPPKQQQRSGPTKTYGEMVIAAIHDLGGNASLYAIRKHVKGHFCGKTEYKDYRLKHALKKLEEKRKIKRHPRHAQTYMVVVVKANESRRPRRAATQRTRAPRRAAVPVSTTPELEEELRVSASAMDQAVTSALGTAETHEEYDATLKDVNAEANRRRFHHLRVVKSAAGAYHTVFQYGRIGTAGTTSISDALSLEDAVASYEKKLREKSAKYEMIQRVSAAGGEFGFINICLTWNNEEQRNDLDLHVITPSGEEIYFGHKLSRCEGNLDVDRMQDTDKCVENIVWQQRPPAGRYKVYVNNYSHNGFGEEKPFDLMLMTGSMEKKWSSSMAFRGKKMHMFDFDFDGNKVVPLSRI